MLREKKVTIKAKRQKKIIENKTDSKQKVKKEKERIEVDKKSKTKKV